MWKAYDTELESRLILGTASYPSPESLFDSIKTSKCEAVTVSLRRTSKSQKSNIFWEMIKESGVHVLPNTAGCHSAQEAITTAMMARDLFETNWIKLEVIGDDYTLQPDPIELLKATEALVKEGFQVFPYMTDDLVLANRLVELGCKVLMPWASPIGSGCGILNLHNLNIIRQRHPEITLLVDAGIGRPSDAAIAMEIGYDAVLLNTAVSKSLNPPLMAQSFAKAIQGGRGAYEAGIIPKTGFATPSTAVAGTPFWHQS